MALQFKPAEMKPVASFLSHFDNSGNRPSPEEPLFATFFISAVRDDGETFRLLLGHLEEIDRAVNPQNHADASLSAKYHALGAKPDILEAALDHARKEIIRSSVTGDKLGAASNDDVLRMFAQMKDRMAAAKGREPTVNGLIQSQPAR